jgi:hypothetical protein
MTRHQLRAIVAWQTTLTLVIALVVGVPLGVAVGRWAWRGFAGSLGVAPVTAVPVLLLAAGCATVILAGTCWPRSPRRWPPGPRPRACCAQSNGP